ncbi:unnamed protein product, partial [Didymodactylos carnosus]
DYIFSNLNLTERQSSTSVSSDSNRTSVNVNTQMPMTTAASSHKSLMTLSNYSYYNSPKSVYTLSVGSTCETAINEYNSAKHLKDLCTSIWKLIIFIIMSAFAIYQKEKPTENGTLNMSLQSEIQSNESGRSGKRKRSQKSSTAVPNNSNKDDSSNNKRSMKKKKKKQKQNAQQNRLIHGKNDEKQKNNLNRLPVVTQPQTVQASPSNLDKPIRSILKPSRIIIPASKKQTINLNGDVDTISDEKETEDESDDNEKDEQGSKQEVFKPWLNDRVPIDDSFLMGQHLFSLIISPIPLKQFFKRTWQKSSLLVRRHNKSHYNGLFSTEMFDRILRENVLEYGDNIDITFYNPTTNKKELHNSIGRVYAAKAWDFYNQNCSIRLLNPQTYSDEVWKLLSCLQEYFCSLVGANVYLTPPGSAGFAPHYDDIDAFILQLEGKKHWKVYAPLSPDEVLPLHSSGDLDKTMLLNVDPVVDTVLEKGDLLYMPRGFIHQANTLDDMHSLHLTVSCYQKNTWGDYLKILLSKAVDQAMATDVEFRQGLPMGYLNHFGFIQQQKSNKKRENFHMNCQNLLKKLNQDYIPSNYDHASDEMAKNFIQDALPPVLNLEEKFTTIHEQGEQWNPKNLQVSHIVEISPDTCIRIIRRHCIRIVNNHYANHVDIDKTLEHIVEQTDLTPIKAKKVDENDDSSIIAYYNLENARSYHDRAPSTLDVEGDVIEALKVLIRAYPNYVSVDELPLASMEDKQAFVTSLYERSIVRTLEPLEPMDDDDDDTDESDIEESDTEEPTTDTDDDDYDDGDDDDDVDEPLHYKLGKNLKKFKKMINDEPEIDTEDTNKDEWIDEEDTE